MTKKLTRIRPKVEVVIPDIPVEPNYKIAMNIFGPLPLTTKGNEYILTIQDMLKKYLLLILMKNIQA